MALPKEGTPDQFLGFPTPPLPSPYVSLGLGTAYKSQSDRHATREPVTQASLAEAGTLGMEFRELANRDPKARHATLAMDRIGQALATKAHLKAFRGLLPNDAHTFMSTVTLGALGDSYYEYLLKEWLQDRSRTDKLKEFQFAANAIRERMLVPTAHPNTLFVVELEQGHKIYKMDHLVCFLPAVFALGAHYGALPSDYMGTAESILETCILMYELTPSGLAPEITKLGEDGQLYVVPADTHNLLRPETVESLFTLYRLTRKERYREAAWAIFEAFKKHSRVPTGGYTSIKDVFHPAQPTRGPMDEMPSYWVAETLKYMWLTFNDGEIPLDKWVFTTEAHPFPVCQPSVRTRIKLALGMSTTGTSSCPGGGPAAPPLEGTQSRP